MKKKKKLIIVTSISAMMGIGVIAGVSTWIATHKPEQVDRGGNIIDKEKEDEDKKFEIINPSDDNIIDFDTVVKDNPNVDLPEEKIKSNNLISKDTKIKYVAIGDSITAGFDGTLDKDYKGSYENGVVNGLSYPSYLSRLFNQINRLESFNNYSVTASTINEWIDLLQIASNSRNLVDESKLISRFGKDYKLLASEIVKQLKNSNLITLSIGANDFIHTFIDAIKESNITQSLQLILNDNPTFGPLIEDVKKILDNSIKEVSKRLQIFASQIKSIAAQANINFISYPTPFLKLKYMIDDFIKEFAGDIAKDFSLTDFFTDILNNTIKLTASKNGINYIDPVNNEFWNKNSQKMSSIWFDIHPNTNGYKKMAVDLFIKLTNPSLNIKDYENLGNFNFSNEFLKSDYQTVSHQIEIDDYSKVIKEIIGASDWEFINKKDDFELQIDSLRSTDNFGKRMLRVSGSFKKITQGLISTLVKSDYIKIIDPNGSLQNFLTENNFKRSEQIVEWLLNSGYLSDLISNLQNEITKLVEENPEASIFDDGVISKILINSLTDEKSILNLLKTLAKSDFIQQNKNEIRELSSNLKNSKLIEILFSKLKVFVSPYITKLIDNPNFTQEKVSELIEKSIQQNDLEDAIIALINDFLDTSDEMEEVNSFYDLFVKIISNGKTVKALKNPISKVIQILLSDKEVISLISNKVKEFLTEYDILLNVDEKRFDLLLQSLLNNESIKDLANSLVNVSVESIINFVRNNHQNYNEISKLLVDAIKSILNLSSSSNLDITQLLIPVFEILNSNVLDNNIDIIETMLYNFLESKKINHSDLIFSIIPSNIKQLIDDFTNIEELKNKLSNIINNENNKNILVKSIINAIKEKTKSKVQINDVNDILFFVAKGFAQNDRDSILEFVKSIKDELEIEKSIRKIIEKFYEIIGLDHKTLENSKLISDVTLLVDSFIKDDKNIETLTDNLLYAIKNSNNFDSLKDNTSNLLISYIKNLLNISEFNFNEILNKLLNSEIVNENQNAIRDLIKAAVNYLLEDNNQYLEMLLTSILDDGNNSNSQLISTISSKLKTNSFKLIINRFINNLLSENWVSKLKDESISTIIYNSLKDKVIINEIKNNKETIISLLKLPKIKTSIVELIIKQTKELGLNEEIFNYDEFASNLFENLINSLLRKSEVNDILDLIINAFENSSSLNQFLDDVKNQISQNSVNLLKTFLPSIVKSVKDVNSPIKTSQFIQNIIKLIINQDNVVKLLDSFQIQTKFDLTKYDELKRFITNELMDTEFKKLIGKISLALVDGIQKTNIYADNIIDEIIKQTFSSSNIDQELISIVNDKLIKAMNNEAVQELMTKLLIKTIEGLNYGWIFENVQNPEFVVTKLIKLIVKSNDKLGISQKILQSLLSQLSSNGTQLNIKDILLTFGSLFNIESEDGEKTIVEFINSLATEQEISKLATDLKTIIINVFNKIKNDPKFLNTIATKLFEYVDMKSIFAQQGDFEDLIIEIFNNDNFNLLLNQIIDLFFGNVEKLDKASNFEELFKVLFANFKFNELGQNLDNLFNDLINSESFLKLLTNIIKNQFILIDSGLSETQIQKLSTDLANDIPQILNILGVQNNLFSSIANELDNLNKDNQLVNFKQILDVIIKKLSSDLSFDLKNKLNKLLKLKSIQSNKEEFIILISAYLTTIKDKFINESLYEKLFEIEYQENKKINLLIDKNEIYSLLNLIKVNPNFDKLVINLTRNIINNPDVLISNDTKDIINSLIFSSDSQNKNILASLIENVLEQFDISDLQKTLNKFIERLCIDNNLTYSTEQINLFTTSFINYLKNDQSKLNISKISFAISKSIKNSSNIDQFIKNIQVELLQIININNYEFVKDILNSDLISPLKEFISENFDYLYNKIFDEINIFEKIKSIDLSSQLNIKNDKINPNFVSIIEMLESDPDFRNVFKQIIKDTIINIDKYKEANSYIELFSLILKNQENLSKNSEQIKNIINKLLNNTELKELASIIIEDKLFNNVDLNEIFNGVTNTSRFASNIIELISSANNKFNLSSLILNNLIKEISNENFSINEFLSSSFSDFKNIYLSNEKDIVEFIKYILNQKIWTEDKQNILQIIKNIINSNLSKIINVDSLLNILVNDTEYLDIQSLKSIIEITTGTREFKNIVNKIIDGINTDNINLENVATYSQLFSELLKNTDFNSIRSDVKNLVNSLLKNHDVQINISSIIEKVIYKFTKIVPNHAVKKLSEDLATNLHSILEYNELLNKIIDSIFDKVEEIKGDNSNFEQIISEIPNSITNSIKQVISDPLDFVKFIFNNPLISNNYQGLNYIIQNGLENIINIPQVKDRITNLSDLIDEKWVDRDEIRNLISELITNNKFINLVKNSASNLLKSNKWINKNTIDEIVFEVLKQSQLLNNYQEIIEILNSALKSNPLTKTFNKILNNLLIDNNIINKNEKLSITLTNSLYDVLITNDSFDLLNKVFEIINNNLNSSLTFEQLFNQIKPELLSSIKQNYYQIVKNIFDSRVISKNKDEIKRFINTLLNNFVPNNIEKWVDRIDLTEYTSRYEFNESEIKNALVDVFNSTHIVDITDAVIDDISARENIYKNTNNIEEFVQTLLWNNQTREKIENSLSSILKEFISKPNIKNIIKKILVKELNGPTIDLILEAVLNKENLVSNIIDIYSDVDSVINLTKSIVSSITEEIKSNGFSISISSIVSNIFSKIKENNFNSENAKEIGFNLIKVILDSKLVNENKDDLIKIINNLIKLLSNEQTISQLIDGLSDSAKNELFKYSDKDDLVQIIKFISTNTNFNQIINVITQDVLNNVSVLKQAVNFDDFMSKILPLINFDKLRDDIKGLINDLLTNQNIRKILKKILNQTLTSYGATNDNKLELMISDIVNEIDVLVSDLELLEPIIDKTIDLINSAKNSDDPNSFLVQIPTEISKIISKKISENPYQFVNGIIKHKSIKNNFDTLTRTVQEILIFLINDGTIENILIKQINSIDPSNELFNYANKNDLIELIRFILKDIDFQNIIKNIIPKLLNNREWLNDINNINELIKSIFQINGIIDENKTNINNLVEKIITNTQVKSIATKSLIYISKQNEINLNISGINQLVDSTLDSIIPILKDLNLYEELISDVLNILKDPLNITTSINQLINKLKNKLVENNFEIIQKLLASRIFNDAKNKATLKVIVSELLNKLDNPQNIKNFVKTLGLEKLLEKFNLTSEQISTLSVKILNNNNTISLLKDIAYNIIENSAEYSTSQNYNDLIKKVFNKTSIRNSFKTNFSSVIKELLNDNEVRNIIVDPLNSLLTKLENNWLLKNTLDSKSLLSELLTVANSINNNLNLTDKLINALIDELKINGIEINFTNIINSISNSLTGEFENNLDQKVTDLFKIVAQTNIFRNSTNYYDLKVVLTNILDYLNQNQIIANAFVNSLSSSTLNEIYKYTDEPSLKAAITIIFDNQHLKNSVFAVLDSVKTKNDRISQASNLTQIVQISLDDAAIRNTIKDELKLLLRDIFTDPTIKTILNNVVKHFFNFIEINSTNIPEADSFMRMIVDDLYNLLNRLDLIDNLVDPLIDQIGSSNNIISLFSSITSQIFDNLKITEYATFSKFLKDNLVTQNKKTIVKIISHIINKLTSDETKIRRILEKLDIPSLLLEDTSTLDKNKINNFIIKVLKNEDLKKLLRILVEEVINNNLEYAKLNNWWELINKLLNSSKSTDIKNSIKKWLIDTVNSNDIDFENGMGELLVEILRKSGFNLIENDKKLFGRVMKNALKAIVNTNDFDQIINKIYDNIKNLKPSASNPITSEKISEAVMKGVLSIISNDDGSAIQVIKILDKSELIGKIINQIGSADFVKLIDRIFESSSLTQNTGIYSILKPILSPNSSSSSSSSSSVKVEIGTLNVLTIPDKAKGFLAQIFKPFYEELFKKAINKSLPTFKQDTVEYRNLFRITEIVLWFLRNNNPSGVTYWNTNLLRATTLEGIVNLAHQKAMWDDLYIPIYKKPIDVLRDETSYRKIGFINGGFNMEFVFGSRSNWTYNYNYDSDQLLAYIYYINDGNDRHNPSKTKEQVLWEALERGYLGPKK